FAHSIAEYFRDIEGKNVLLMLDSVTRVALAQREIGLAVGEPPATRGYTPSVFALLPRLLERSGTGSNGSITALYTVLVEGDDLNEPVSDVARGVLDGHIVLSRDLAHKNHFPAIDVLQSISRVMPQITDKEHVQLAGDIRRLMASYQEAQDLINVGAYQQGSNPLIDKAISAQLNIKNLLIQSTEENFKIEDTMALMKKCVS
ncbi:MAG: flagellar protein export ATPase FliI, partial [Cyanobacteriota bacterium]